MVQEIYETQPAIRDACEKVISGHARMLEADIVEAIKRRGLDGQATAESLALHIQGVIQGAFVLAKARNGAAVAGESLDHLRRYLDLLFVTPHTEENPS